MKSYMSVVRMGHYLSKSHYLARRRLTPADWIAILRTRLMYWRDNVTHGAGGVWMSLVRRFVRPVREVNDRDLREMLREAFERERVKI